MELPNDNTTYQVGDIFCHKNEPTYKIQIVHVGEKEYDFTSNSIQQFYSIIHTNNNNIPPSDISAIALNKYYTKHYENKARIP